MFDPAKPSCERCKKLYKQRLQKAIDAGGDYDPERHEPPCDECLPPLDPANYESWLIFNAVSTQYIMGIDGPVDINHLAVWKMIDEYKIKNRHKVFENILILSRHMIGLIREEIEREKK